MVDRTHESHKLTYRVNLPGGQDRLREMILHVSGAAQDMTRLGVVKLNKIIWKADFSAFAARGQPVTGRAYQRLPLGPAPVEMAPLLAEMLQDQLISFQLTNFGKDKNGRDIIERRPVSNVKASLRLFSQDDLDFVDQSIAYYWDMTGTETSDDSHGPAWKTRRNLDPMPYESAYLAAADIPEEQMSRIMKMAQEMGWTSA